MKRTSGAERQRNDSGRSRKPERKHLRRSVTRKTAREPHAHRKDETGYGLSTGEVSADESTRESEHRGGYFNDKF